MLPVLPVIVPLFAASVLVALSKWISQRASQWIAIAATLITLWSDALLMYASAAQPLVYWFGNWKPRSGIALGITFTIEPLGAGLATFSAVLMLAALVFSSRYFDTVDNHFHSLLMGFLAALCGFCLTGDLFNMFVFFELMSAAGFALCGYKTDDAGSLQGAFNFAVVNTIAAYFVLTGIALLYSRTGALNMAQAGRALGSAPPDALVTTGFAFLIFGYLVKAAVVPFHFWLADAHAVAPTPVCILFSGVMVEMGLFALARLRWTVFDSALHLHAPVLVSLFVTTGAVTAVLGTVMCWIQRNLKRLLAFSTIGHVGLMTIGVGLSTPQGLAGAAVYVLGHGMVKAGLFLVAGLLLHRFQSVDECDLRGKGRAEPWAGAVYLAGAVALAGVPCSGLWAGAELIQGSGEAAGFEWIRWLCLAVDGVTSAAVIRAGGRIFGGWGPLSDAASAPRHEEKPETKQGHEDTPVWMILPAAVLVLAGLFFGLVPGLTEGALAAAARFENGSAYAAHVLEGMAIPVPASLPPAPRGISTGLLAVLAAFAIAGGYLFNAGLRHIFRRLPFPTQFLHRIHSGHPGDYVVFLTFGMAFFGLLCACLLR